MAALSRRIHRLFRTPDFMSIVSSNPNGLDVSDWVPETRFGKWFIGTDIWIKYVLRVAIADFARLLGPRLPSNPVLLDAGCGIGLSFPLLDEVFKPRQIIGADIDLASLQRAAQSTGPQRFDLRLLHADARRLDLPDDSVDLIFCHQLLHHVMAQSAVLAELRRVLRPGGFLLSGESCRAFIQSLWVTLLFRHPDMVQKSAQDYVALIRAAGFEVAEADVSQTVPWWSRVDFGLLQRWGLPQRPHEITEVNTVAMKPLHAA